MMMLESLQVNQSSTRGYWGEPTATVDWCENNYDLTHYIAEFFNTLSSLCMVFVGMFGVYMHSKGFETRFLVCFTTIIIVGIGSILFHGTLLFPLQLLDEVPMMFCVLTLCYSIVENKKKKRFGIWFPISLTIWGLVVTSIMIFSGRFHYDKKMQLIEFYIFQGSFAAMSAVFYIYIVLLIVRPRRYSPKYIKRLWLVGSLVFLIGYVGWHVDMNFCDWVNRLPHGLPNPQLHAWWHLAASYGSYAMCILAAYDRSKILGQDVCIKWAFFEILPYVHIVTLEERKKVFTKSKKKNKLVKEKRKLEFLNDDRSPDSNQEKIPLLRDSESDFSS